MDLRDLYQDIILDHGRHPRNFGALEDASHFAHGHNPLCGDKLTVFLKLENGRVANVRFQGQGCAISTASASLMTEIVLHKTLAEAQALFTSFHMNVTGGELHPLPPELEEDYERLQPLAGVKSYPTRVKCATLAWHTFEAAIQGGGIGPPVKTE
jgi:nitrogen fixation NifU-like protein